MLTPLYGERESFNEVILQWRLKKAIKTKALNKTFKIEVPNEVYENLLKELEAYEN